MNYFTTIATFTFPSEMFPARALLETKGIECNVKDELTAQVHNFYSQAIGGVKLQVRENDYDRARDLLIEAGYIKDEKPQLSGFWKGVDKFTRRIPVIKELALEVRFLIIIALFFYSSHFCTYPSFSSISEILLQFKKKPTKPVTF